MPKYFHYDPLPDPKLCTKDEIIAKWYQERKKLGEVIDLSCDKREEAIAESQKKIVDMKAEFYDFIRRFANRGLI